LSKIRVATPQMAEMKANAVAVHVIANETDSISVKRLTIPARKARTAALTVEIFENFSARSMLFNIVCSCD